MEWADFDWWYLPQSYKRSFVRNLRGYRILRSDPQKAEFDITDSEPMLLGTICKMNGEGQISVFWRILEEELEHAANWFRLGPLNWWRSRLNLAVTRKPHFMFY